MRPLGHQHQKTYWYNHNGGNSYGYVTVNLNNIYWSGFVPGLFLFCLKVLQKKTIVLL